MKGVISPQNPTATQKREQIKKEGGDRKIQYGRGAALRAGKKN